MGYATWRRWRVYGEEGLAGREAALWLQEKTLTVEYGGGESSALSTLLLARLLPRLTTDGPSGFTGAQKHETGSDGRA